MIAVDNFLSEIIHADYTIFAEDTGGGGEPTGHEAFRVADGRRSSDDYATAENPNQDWRLVVQLPEARIANFIALDRGHNLEGFTVQVQADDDPNFSTAQTIVSVTIPSALETPSDLRVSPGTKTLDGAWLYVFENDTAFENYRIVVPAMGAGLRPRIVGAFLGIAWQPEHAAILPYAPDGQELVVEETLSEAQWAGAARPAHRRHGSVRINSADFPDRQNARRYIESMLWRGRLAWWLHNPARGEESWLGRVPSGGYAFSETAEWPLGETTFSLREHEPQVTTSGALAIPTTVGALSRTSSGLLARYIAGDATDPFDAGDWTTSVGTLSLDGSGNLQITGLAQGNTPQIYHNSLGAFGEVLLFATVRFSNLPPSAIVEIGLAAHMEDPAGSAVVARFFRDSSLTSDEFIGLLEGGATTDQTEIDPVENNYTTFTGVALHVDGQDKEMYDQAEGLTHQITGEADSSGLIGMYCRRGPANDITAWQWGSWFAFSGRNVTVTGLPIGSTVEILDAADSVLASGSASGGSAVIDMIQEVWPGPVKVRVKNSGGTAIATLEPSDGVWGGDTYAFTFA